MSARVKQLFSLPGELVERLKNAADYLPGENLSSIAERALTREIKRLEKRQGAEFPQRKGQLKGGRRMS